MNYSDIYKNEELPTKDRKLAVLEDTITYYSEDPKRRCKQGKACFYSGKSVKADTEGCAIGRLLPKEVSEFLDETGYGGWEDEENAYFMLSSSEYNKHKETMKSLPAWFKSLDTGNFFQRLQNLHDEDLFWDKNGLNLAGKQQVDAIKLNI